MQDTKFRRPARDYTLSFSSLPRDEIALLSPPTLQVAQGGAAAWLMQVLPIVGGVVGPLALISFTHPSLLLIFVYVGMGLLLAASGIVTGVIRQRAQQKQQKEKNLEYVTYLKAESEKLKETADLQIRINDHLFPPSTKLAQIVTQRNQEQPPQLWERRIEDLDFLRVRVGLGNVPLCRDIRITFAPLTKYIPELRAKAENLTQEFAVLPDAPFTIDVATIGTLAITGNPLQTRSLMRAILCQLAAFHSPDDVRFVAYFPKSASSEWEWFKWLPHARRLYQVKSENQFATEQLCLLADTIEDYQEILSKQIAPELARRRQISDQKREAANALNKPHIVFILDDFSADHALARLPEMQELLQSSSVSGIDPAHLGVTVICLTETIRQEPSTIKARITVSDHGELTFQKIGAGSSREDGIVADSTSIQICEQVARGLAPLTLAGQVRQQDLLLDVRLLHLLDIPSAERIRVEQTWRSRSLPEILRVPIGLKADGAPLLLDLKEAADRGMGPHGLVVGATGSGKSELLRTLVSSLAITHDPHLVNFLLVDFKGGASFADFASLPHIAGIVTNLKSDQMMVNRIYESLQGELERRQRLLREAGNLDNIKEYRGKWQANRASIEPMPHLLIIVDEFAELISERPDFLDLFVQIGRLGRSLGMHLLLSTQRLEEGRIKGLESYLRYRICLRTFSSAESRIALGTDDAFYLPSAPGVGYFKVDADTPIKFKTALISTPYSPPSTESAQGVPIRIFTPTGKLLVPGTINTVERQREDVRSKFQTEMDVVISRLEGVQYQGGKATVHQVCLPLLPRALPLKTLFNINGKPIFDGKNWPTIPPFGLLRIPVGLKDTPLEQTQEPLILDFSGPKGHVAFVGAPLSGKSTLLRTIVTALMITHTPRDVQMYGIDLGGGLLGVFESQAAHAPHVGSICNRAALDKIRRLIHQMRTTIQERTLYFQDHNIDSMQSYRLQRHAGKIAGDALSDVFLIIDNLPQFRRDFDQLEPELIEIIANGLTYGVHVIVSANRWNDIPQKLLQYFGTRLELHIHDPAESDIGKALAAALPSDMPGRGLATDKLYFQTALPQIDTSNIMQQSLEALVRQTQEAWQEPVAPEIRMLPLKLSRLDLLEKEKERHTGVPIGIDEYQLQPVYFDLPSMGPHFLIFGDTECGKTNLLRLWIRELEKRYTPDQVQIAVVDYRRKMLRDIGQSKDPHLFGYAYNLSTLTECITRLKTLLEVRSQAVTQETIAALDDAPAWNGPHYFLFVDDYETIITPLSNPFIGLSELLYNARDIGFHFVLARRAAGALANSMDSIIKRVKDTESPGLVMSANPQEGMLLGTHRSIPLPPGRGYLIRRKVLPTQIQVACLE
jgi:S-DNA-T family DNA segregation ATPase FtsK/SpoIIIE